MDFHFGKIFTRILVILWCVLNNFMNIEQVILLLYPQEEVWAVVRGKITFLVPFAGEASSCECSHKEEAESAVVMDPQETYRYRN